MERPDWLDKDPKQWPACARIAYGILLRSALRRMEQQAAPTAITAGANVLSYGRHQQPCPRPPSLP